MVGFGNVAGYVLVGGRSSRMGTDKALIPFRGLPLAGYVADQLARVADPVSLVGDPARYANVGYPTIADEYPGAGPLGAIITGLRSSKANWNLMVACDLPRVHGEFFASLVEKIRHTSAEAVIPVTPDGREQVLCAAYRRDALVTLTSVMETGERKLRNAILKLRAEYWVLDSAVWLVNVNTPEEWARLAREV